MICEKCNARNNYYYNFCYNCGAKLNGSLVELKNKSIDMEDNAVILNKQRTTFNPHLEGKKRKKRLTYALLLLATVTLCFTICFVFTDLLK